MRTSESVVIGGKLRVSPWTLRRAKIWRVRSEDTKAPSAPASPGAVAMRAEFTICFWLIGPANSTNLWDGENGDTDRS